MMRGGFFSLLVGVLLLSHVRAVPVRLGSPQQYALTTPAGSSSAPIWHGAVVKGANEHWQFDSVPTQSENEASRVEIADEERPINTLKLLRMSEEAFTPSSPVQTDAATGTAESDTARTSRERSLDLHGSRYGRFLKRTTTSTGLPRAVDAETDFFTDLSHLIDNHGPEIVALCLFVLLPITFLLVEMAERVWRHYTPEQFPQRGRGPVRLCGTERQLKALANCEREKIAAKQWRRKR
ncbi:hypothetical protein ASPZODRAFT_135014 [Penicilliopsis zonata CBS 506.65]|uniref:Transmembrane protein n=1 Tax=Penicilliopsis zonata CBS 506.65 TaxID=1073090 RepID=A0A1L9SAN6_9EURO|nr:hypothetical protein ASPZODRAFT_135014 [Penicilliopsis zonata CBS 506.65]OJJ44224.1 hypothetical protein ASPZODRAFT_135014 [Penicilliopsis zonata CBS 506.65]